MTIIEKLKALNEAGTEGKWVAGNHPGDWGFSYVNYIQFENDEDPKIELRYGGIITAHQSSRDNKLNSQSHTDAQLIALMRNFLPQFLALAKAVQEYFDTHYVMRLTEPEKKMTEALAALKAECP